MAESNDDAIKRLKQAKEIKEEGTKLLLESKYIVSINSHRKVLELLEDQKMDNESETERKDLVKKSQLNIALAWLKLEVRKISIFIDRNQSNWPLNFG